MTSNHHAPYDLGDTRATMVETKGSEAARQSKTQKSYRSPDCSLQLECMKLESLVIAGQPYCGEYVLGPCTHRPSHHESRKTPEAGGRTERKELSKVGLMIGVKS